MRKLGSFARAALTTTLLLVPACGGPSVKTAAYAPGEIEYYDTEELCESLKGMRLQRRRAADANNDKRIAMLRRATLNIERVLERRNALCGR